MDRWLANTPLGLEQKASLCYLLTSCSSEFLEFLNRLFTPPLAILGPFTPSSSTPSFYSSLTLSRLAGLGGLLYPHRTASSPSTLTPTQSHRCHSRSLLLLRRRLPSLRIRQLCPTRSNRWWWCWRQWHCHRPRWRHRRQGWPCGRKRTQRLPAGVLDVRPGGLHGLRLCMWGPPVSAKESRRCLVAGGAKESVDDCSSYVLVVEDIYMYTYIYIYMYITNCSVLICIYI